MVTTSVAEIAGKAGGGLPSLPSLDAADVERGEAIVTRLVARIA
ncbi:MAG: hypothetical protein ACRDRW_11335 [Pseudonocardiaceae bacterium]